MSLDGRFTRRVYNTLVGGSWDFRLNRLKIESEDGDVLRCPECSAEIDVDEDEVEEGEILSCPECESELEVSQIHPVHLNIISDDGDDDDDEEEEEEEEEAEDGDKSDVIEEEE